MPILTELIERYEEQRKHASYGLLARCAVLDLIRDGRNPTPSDVVERMLGIRPARKAWGSFDIEVCMEEVAQIVEWLKSGHAPYLLEPL